MSDQWDAPLATTLRAPERGPPAWLDKPDPADGPASTEEPAAELPVKYGLVARMALSQPGFGFRVEHDLPGGVDLVEARPRATVVGDHLIWQFGRVDPGQQVRLEVVVRPQPGTVLSPDEMATFTATYSQNLYFQVPVLRPRLAARMSGPAAAEPGTDVEFVVEVANTGNCPIGDARAAVTLPAEFAHPDGPTVRCEVGPMKQGEVRRLTIPARAVPASPFTTPGTVVPSAAPSSTRSRVSTGTARIPTFVLGAGTRGVISGC